MKKSVHLGTILLLLMGLFSNTTMAQGVFTWNGNISTSWTTAGNWTKTGSPTSETYPGEFNSTNTVTIINTTVNAPVIAAGSYKISRLNINNSATNLTGGTLTINSGATLVVDGTTAGIVTLNGGNIINDGTLSIKSTSTGSNGFLTTGITCATPSSPPTVATEYGYKGGTSSNLIIDISAAVYLGAAAVSVTSTNANSNYQMLFNGTTTISLGTALNYTNATSTPPNLVQPTNFFAFRAAGGANASKLIVGGTGFTLGSVGSPIVNGGLFSVGAQSTITVNAGTNLTMHSSSTNVTRGIHFSSAITNATTFTNKGIINILGTSSTSGILLTTFSTGADLLLDINNEGTLNVDLNCTTVGSAPLATGNGGSTGTTTTSFKINNIGIASILTLKNNSNAAGTGAAIFGFVAGQAPPVVITNGGTLNLEGSSYSYGNKFTITNNGILNTNNELRSFTAINNNVGGSINFARTAATATTRQVVFNGLQTTDLSGAIGSVYTDGTNNYTVVSQKFGSGTTMVANVLSSATIPASGTLTTSGGGTVSVNYSSFSTSAINGALSSTTTNSGTINTDTASNLSIISGVTTTSNSIIAPGGSAGKGLASFSAASQTISGTISIEVAGNTTAGVDYDQIISTANNGSFDISAATLEITSLYTPTSSVSIPIVTASGGGTISGTFASITGLNAGWALDYSAQTAVNLVYTVAIVLPPPTIWTGVADNNFFNEANWVNTGNSQVPAANSINPGVDINLNLQINSAAATITSGAIQFGTGRLAIGSANVTATSLSGGTVTINNEGYLNLSSATPLLNNVQINFTSGLGWIRTPNYNAKAVSDNNLGQIKVNSITAVYAGNLRLDHYYLNGCVIRANLAATTPLIVYEGANLGGNSAAISVNVIHSNTGIANSMNNNIESFLLKKGFMATVAIENDGTGKSKNYIASETDLVINILPQTLQNSISFIRVMPWNWVTKKGFNAPVDDNLDASWRYQWNPNQSSTIDHEFAPMAWGHTSANDPADITLLVNKYNSPYVMSFNEPDDCNGQSGEFGDLCQTDVAVGYHKNLMKTGMRIVSPGGREEAPFGWLKTFYDKAVAQDVRIDVIAVHWYDWSAVLDNNANNDTAALAAGRFLNYLNNVHNLYGLPIWITEFNANPARSQAVNAEFLSIVLPELESLDYIERYCWFPFNTGTHFTTGWDEVNRVPTNTIPSLVGTIYKNIDNTTPVNSTPSVPEATVNADNSLDLANNPNVALGKPATSSSSWSGNVASRAVDGDTTSSTSRWLVEFATSPLPGWLEVNLQGSFTIDSFRIFEGAGAVRNFQFQIWDATLNSGLGGWSTSLTVTNNPVTPVTTFWTITPVATTRVRLFVTAHNDSAYIRMFELEVYGLKNNPTWTGGTSSAWSTASNWSTGVVPDQFSNVLIGGGATFQPTVSATTTINSLAIAAGATLSVTAPNFTVKGAIDNDGTMTLSNNSNLLQGEEFNPNTGNIVINRNSSALSRLDYTIWSSPVEIQNLADFSPATSLNRFYNYNQTTNLYNAIANPSTTNFGLAAGHLIRMPNTHPTTPTVWNGTFTGVPNNGTINRVVTYRNEAPLNFGYNMIGNPYPSTLNANAFITENTSKIENILYFWRKTNGLPGSAYATWISGMGGTASEAGSAVPNGTIQVGQGFFVRAKPGTDLSKLTFNQNLTFKNDMRLGSTSTQFFKTKQEEKDRIWLNLTNTAGVFSQTLVGYLTEGTKGLDDFDGKYINDSPVALTSNINNEEYTIQSRATFDPTDVVSLNFKTDVAGEYTIAIDHFDGIFANGQDVYLVDRTTETEIDIKNSNYTFSTLAGIFNDRFSLKYQKTLKVDAKDFNENNVRVYIDNETLYVNSGNLVMENIKVYDIQGRLLVEQKNVKSTVATIKEIKAKDQVLIVKITNGENTEVTKKVIH